jgi:hypothetical protein
VLLGFGAPYQLRLLAGLEHGRTIPLAEIAHLMEKTNFLQCVQESARKLGRLSLADRLSRM